LFALPGFRRQNRRLNADQGLGRRVDLGSSGFYGHSRNADAVQGPGSPFFALRFLDPSVHLWAPNPDGTPYLAKLPDDPVNAFNPLYALANIKRDTERSRLIGGAVLRWRPLDWLAAEANCNLDHEQQDFSELIPVGYLTNQGQPLSGNRSTTTSTGRFRNAGVAVTATRRWSGPAVRKQWYYRIGAVWQANVDLKIRALDELQLHAAYGTAGLRPDLSLEAFAFTPIGSGIDALRPSRSGELELGANLQGRGGRFTLEYAYARKKTTDQIVLVDLPTPVGFIQALQNRGALEASTHELTPRP
jgi:outer membrane receptor protein involved in Fe transport